MIWMGGAGATLSLVIAMLIFARSKNMREVARLGAGASVFNINEPILFGLPVIMNPIMLIPFNLVPLVLVTVQYAAMKIGAVAVTTGVFIPRTLPPVISGFIVTGHLSGSVMQLINLLIGAMLYLPFMRITDKQYRAAEADYRYANRHHPCKTGVKHVGNYRNGEWRLKASRNLRLRWLRANLSLRRWWMPSPPSRTFRFINPSATAGCRPRTAR